MDRRLSWFAGGVVALIVAGGCGLGGNDAQPVPVAAVPTQTSEVPASEAPASEAPTAESAVETESPSPSASTKTKKAKAKPKPSRTSATPTEDPNNFQLPECAHYEGKAVSKAKAKAALKAAAARRYWPGSAPGLTVPGRLVIATAWHESGWTSNVVNCDGGHGLMQVMPDTEAFINQRFEQSYDATDYKQNAVLGANYLAWLTKAFGDTHFKGSYDLSAKKCRTHASPCLLNMVIAGYNMGRGAVDAAYEDKEIPNPGYVDSVRSLMTSCFCDKY
ncbi:transglycosylase SLT domain-containing protein [Actinoplanes sp. NPDC051494]|uniref:transglycosylase SLT domain-containing protein n=1 Tax=Actinoplanes sp. NPDC051494 TaxID=3363907 RepID=UPI003787F349